MILVSAKKILVGVNLVGVIDLADLNDFGVQANDSVERKKDLGTS